MMIPYKPAKLPAAFSLLNLYWRCAHNAPEWIQSGNDIALSNIAQFEHLLLFCVLSDIQLNTNSLCTSDSTVLYTIYRCVKCEKDYENRSMI